jgi:hypothetical protein
MTSLRRLAANQQNARKSTGPQSAQGKMRSSANALRHGLRASKFVTMLEYAGEFEELLESFVKDWRPRGITQELEVVRLAQVHYHLQRAQRALAEVLNTEICGAIDTRATHELPSMLQRLERFGAARGKLDEKESKRCQRLQQSYEADTYLQKTAQSRVRTNSIGLGSALCCISPNQDKLSTILRYMAHFERAEQRIVQNLRMLQAEDRD